MPGSGMTLPMTGADPGPMARFEELKADAGAPDVIYQRLASGESLYAIAKQWKLPKKAFVQWFEADHGDLCELADKAFAADRALDAWRAAMNRVQKLDSDGRPIESSFCPRSEEHTSELQSQSN